MRAAEAYLSTTTQGGGQGRFFLACSSARENALGGIAGALAVACHAVIVPPREDLCTVRLEMGHIGLRP
jgi:hypothetical protein